MWFWLQLYRWEDWNSLYLNLETGRSSAPTSLLEFASLWAHVRLDTIVGVRVLGRCGVTEMADGFTSVLGTAKEHGVGSLGWHKCQLVESHALSTGTGDGLAGFISEAQSTDLEFRKFKSTSVIGDGSNNDSDFALLALHVPSQSRNWDRGVVEPGHSQTLSDGSSELGISTACEETIDRAVHEKRKERDKG